MRYTICMERLRLLFCLPNSYYICAHNKANSGAHTWLQDIDLVPSHVVPSLTIDKEHNDVYSAYNKPGAVMYWLQVCSMWHLPTDLQPCQQLYYILQAVLQAHGNTSCAFLISVCRSDKH